MIVQPGARFGKLTVTGSLLKPRKNGKRITWYQCQCDCGKSHQVRSDRLEEEKIKGSRCIRGRRNQTRGLTGTPEYYVWYSMIRRCHNPKDKSWHNYGGRGIQVCSRWRNSFLTFRKDMYPKPSLELTLDRWDNNGNYEPSNCHWVTRSYQQKNRRI